MAEVSDSRGGSLKRALFYALSLLLVFLAVRVTKISRYAPQPRPGPELKGVLHLHSTHSDGGEPLAGIAAKARRAGLDFVVVTDHGNPCRLDEPLPEEPLFLRASELSTSAGHLLAIGYETPEYNFPPDPDEAVADIAEQGGISIVAHPFNDHIPWREWPLPKADGMEVLNGDSEWREIGWSRLAVTLPVYWLNPIYFHLKLMHYPRASLAAFDAEASRRHFVLAAGLDAHERISLGGGREIRAPDYLPLFRTLRIRIPGAVPRSREAILRALRSGAFYVSVDGLAEGGGFIFRARAGGEVSEMGAIVSRGGAQFEVVTEAGCHIRLLRDGKEVAGADQSLRHVSAAEGAYRVEVYRPRGSHPFNPDLPWILSNPIFLGPRYDSLPNAVALQPPPSAGGVRIEIAPSRLHVERDYLSAADYDGSHLHFRMGRTRDPRAMPVVALALRYPPPLGPDDQIVVRLRAARTLRLWLQASEGERIFRSTIKCRPEAQEHVVRLSELHAVDGTITRAIDVSKLTGLFLVLDVDAVPQGTEGDLWVESLALMQPK